MNCVICGEKIKTAKRSSRRYCSGACRSKAFNARKREQKAAEERTMTLWDHMDLVEIKRHSVPAYNKMQTLYAITSKEFSQKVLDIVMDVLTDTGLLTTTYLESTETVNDG